MLRNTKMNNPDSKYPNKFTTDGRVNFEFVNAAVKELKFETTHVPNSSLTIVSAFYDGFSVGQGTSSCVNPLNYNPEIGYEIAQKNALAAATNKLWELFGWELHKHLKETHQLFPVGTLPVKDKLDINEGYPALQELWYNIQNYVGSKLTPARHNSNLVTLKDTGKNFRGHQIYQMDNGGPSFIILAGSINTGDYLSTSVEFTYVNVTEPALYQLKSWEVTQTTK